MDSRQSPRPARWLPLLGGLVLGALGPAACDHDDDQIIVVSEQGVVVTDLDSLSDYLNDPAVLLILQSMPRHIGSTPPDPVGDYDADDTVLVASSLPNSPVGSLLGPFAFCFGSPAGGRIDARVIGSGIDPSGTSSFIEGNGNDFTVYTSFVSRDADPVTQRTCEVHQVVVISATRLADGSLTDVSIGQGVVGLVGECTDLFVDDILVSEGTGSRFADACECQAGGGGNPGVVELFVNNFLKNPVVVFVEYPGTTILDPQPFVVRAEEAGLSQFVEPGFTLRFESLQPELEVIQDPLNRTLPPSLAGLNFAVMGELVQATFSQDGVAGGSCSIYDVVNVVGTREYFAPRPTNASGGTIYVLVNTDAAEMNPLNLIGPDAGCLCPILDGETSIDLGYYLHIENLMVPPNTNVRVFDFTNDVEILTLASPPFATELDSGAFEFTVLP
ncbi:MAG: hypothetical protein O7J95_07740 [Planctomycetota bacterium]|nr:hypothetical protein [Planctomycetota bacterium]